MLAAGEVAIVAAVVDVFVAAGAAIAMGLSTEHGARGGVHCALKVVSMFIRLVRFSGSLDLAGDGRTAIDTRTGCV